MIRRERADVVHFVKAVWLAMGVVTLLASGPLPAAEQLNVPAPPLRFRRTYVPADRIEDWPRDAHVRYRPMPKVDFERLVQQLQTTTTETSAVAVRVAAAHYRGTLHDDVLHGDATLEIVRAEPENMALDKAADPGSLLVLEPCGIAVHSVAWVGQPAAEVTFGLDVAGRAAVLVPRSGQLAIQWSLRGTRDDDGRLAFDFELPKVTRSSLELTLPEDTVAASTYGAIISNAIAGDSPQPWRLELGGHHRFTLSVMDAAAAGNQRQALVRQTSTYSFSPRGLELTVQLAIDVGREPLRQFELSLDPRLQLLALRQGESRVGWSIASPTAEATEESTAERRQRILLELPQPLTGTGNIIRLAATAPITLDELWRLPDVRTAGMFWQEGRATLLFPKPLVLEKLATTDCRQTSVGPLPPPSDGETIGIQCFVPEAAMEVVVAHAKQRLRVASAAIMDLVEDSIHARETSELRISDGELFTLEGEVPHEWTIDSVESVPPGRVKDWTLDSPGAGKRRLEVQLEQALSAGAPLRLAVHGHRLHPSLANAVSVAQLRFVEWQESTLGSRAISLRSPDNYHLKLSGEESLHRLNPKQLPAEVETLFAEPVEGLTFLVDAQAAGLKIALERHAPQYTAALDVEVVATAGPVWETYSLLCRPQSSRVERIVVHFSHDRPEPPRWSLATEGESGVVARRIAIEPAMKDPMPTGETWELILKRPRSTPFEIRATRAVELGREPLPISLVSLPEAGSQQGELKVRFSPGAIVEIQNHSLKPLSVDSHQSQHGQRNSVLRAAYHYVPGHDGLAVSPPAIALERQDRSEMITGTVAWRATLQSRYDPAGGIYHVATWLLENEDRSSVRLLLPRDAQEVGVWIDDKRLSPQIDSGSCEIVLPAGRAFPTLVATFRTPGPRFNLLTRITPSQPQIDVPVLADQWIVWLPPGYELPDGTTSPVEPRRFNAWQRLFGPLAQGAGSDALSGLKQWNLVVRPVGQSAADDEQLRQWIEQLGAVPGGGVNSSRSDWGWLLARLETRLASSRHTLLVDWRAVAESGLTPQRPLGDQASVSPWQRGLDRLQQAELVLLVDDRAVLLTTMAAAALYRTQLAPLSQVVVARIRPGALHEALMQAVQQRGSSHFHLADEWVAEPALPWTGRRAPPLDPADVHGWSAYALDLPTTTSAYVVRQSSIGVLGWGLFLLIVVLGWRSQGRPVLLIAMTGAAMVAALVLPAILAPLATSVVLASLFCLVLQTLRPRRPVDRSTLSAQSFPLSDNMPTTAGALVLLLLAATCNCGQAQEAAPTPVHKVFIPTDDQDEFTGEHYWVPESLYARLQHSAAEAARAPRDWLLEQAEYRAEGSWDVAQQRMIIPEIKCNFDLQVFESDCHVVLPLDSGEATPPAEARLLLDGREIVARWSEEGKGLHFDVPDAGHYRLQLSLRPAIVLERGVSNIDLAVPPLPTSRLELHLPRTAPVIEVSSARGRVGLLEDGQHLVAHLGNTPRLTLRWRDGVAGRTLYPVVEADQLVWMHVQPGSVTADVRFKFRVLEGSVRTLQVALDPRWQLQPGGESQPAATQVRGVAGAPQRLQFELPQPVSDQVTIDATLRLAGASGIGAYRIPYLEPLQVRSARHWLALSVDGALEYREHGAEGLTSLSTAEFLSQWAGDVMPQKAYRLATALPPWSVTIHPGASHKVADSLLAVSVGLERAVVRFEATIETSGPNFQHRIVAPPDLAIESVVVIEDDLDRLAHWSRDSDGTLTLFLNELAGGPQQLVIQGSMLLPRRGPWKLPVMRVDDAEFRSAQVRIYRQPLEMVTVRSRSGLLEQPEQQRAIESENPEQDKRFAGMGRLLSLLKAEGPAYAATLHFSPNQPQFSGTQTTTLRRDGSQWQAEVQCQIDVTSGIVDLLRFDIPGNWQGPFQITPPAMATLSDVNSDGARQLVVRPFAPVTGQYQLKLSGPVAAAGSATLEAPAISLTGAQRLTQTLLLPTQLELQPVAWKTRGLMRVDADTTTEGNAALKGMEAFRVVDASYAAELMPAARPVGEPHVYLADVSLAVTATGKVQGVASFDLDPGGNSRCTLHLPPACRLLQVSVNGTPATLSRHSDQAWEVGLGSDQLPQRVETLFTSQLAETSLDEGRWRLIAPHLGELQVQRSLWTVHGPQSWQPSDTGSPRRASALRQELVRLHSIAALVSIGPALVPNDLAEDMEAWYAPWARRFVASLSAVRRELVRTRDIELARSIETEIRGLQQRQLEIVRQLGLPDSLLRDEDEALAAEQSRQVWQWTSTMRSPGIRFAANEPARELVLEPAAPLAADWFVRVVWIVAVVAGAVLAIRLLRSPWSERLVAWRYVAGVALGIVWWFWLTPPLLGWVIVAASLLAAWRQRRRPRREMGSSVIRIGTSTHG